ncbi:MAG TPA: HEPN domain-containing protein [Candidatus Acidoferrum sp.]|nr:HEPN domain-containing protein [Candidatus Acidoferrum sp.]
MRQSLESFNKSLGRIRAILDDIDLNAAQALRDPSVRERFETIRCAMMVTLSGFFESFMRNTAEEFISDLCARAIPFDNLPPRVRTTHYAGGAALLQKYAGKEKNSIPMAESALIARRLASVAAMPYELVQEAFGDTKANPNAALVTDFLGRFGIEEPRRKLIQSSGISEAGFETNFASFIALRNECAHTGIAGNVPTGGEISDYCDFLGKIATAIIDTLESHFALPPLAAAVPPPAIAPPQANP